MTSPLPTLRSHLTLALTALLHAFTHAYGTLLVPLYLLIARDLGLPRVEAVTLILTLYSIVYCILSYPAGILADHLNRKTLLGLGLIGNALAILLMGFTGQYWALLLLGLAAGLFGSVFHPAANALVPAHYPRSPGMAIGMLGAGAGLGFFAGPQFAGWRADALGGDWQRPLVEAGLVGILVGFIYLLVARETAHAPGAQRIRERLGPGMRRRMLAIAAILGCRDFAGFATVSLLSIYLQRAHGFDTRRTGWIIGAMMLISVAANPIAVWLTPERRRLPGLVLVLVAAGLILISVPHISVAMLLPVLAVFQVFHLGSYAISEAAILERVSPAVRGRIMGIFITLAGTFASLSHWVMGFWTDSLGPRAYTPEGYFVPFAVLGGMMLFASLSTRLIGRLGVSRHPRPVDILQEMVPATREPMGG